jgi:serine/threonine-protein kinase BUR1
MLIGKPILAGETDINQLEIIFDLCGTPNDETMPGFRSLPGGQAVAARTKTGNLSQRFREYGSGAVSLLKELLKLNWKTRINAIDALQHPYFRTSPLPANPKDLPTFEDSHELDRRKYHDRKAALPPAPKGGTVGRGALEGHGPNAGFNGGDAYGRNGANGQRYNRGTSRAAPPPAEERLPGWHRERGLPPRPPPPAGEFASGWDGVGDHPDAYRDRDGGRPPRSRGTGGPGGNRPDIDTYIPSYDREREVPRHDREAQRPREERRWRDDREDRRHEWDRPAGRRAEYEERSRTSRTRSRSRSPVRDRERERDMYRR